MLSSWAAKEWEEREAARLKDELHRLCAFEQGARLQGGTGRTIFRPAIHYIKQRITELEAE